MRTNGLNQERQRIDVEPLFLQYAILEQGHDDVEMSIATFAAQQFSRLRNVGLGFQNQPGAQPVQLLCNGHAV